MTNHTFPMGKPEEAKESEGNTAQEKKNAAVTQEPSTKSNDSKDTKQAEGVNKEVWAQAEQAVMNQTGGMHGVSPEGRKVQIQAQYDQMVENDRATKKWAGEDGVLGDVK